MSSNEDQLGTLVIQQFCRVHAREPQSRTLIRSLFANAEHRLHHLLREFGLLLVAAPDSLSSSHWCFWIAELQRE
jgi:hypothetical protein